MFSFMSLIFSASEDRTAGRGSPTGKDSVCRGSAQQTHPHEISSPKDRALENVFFLLFMDSSRSHLSPCLNFFPPPSSPTCRILGRGDSFPVESCHSYQIQIFKSPPLLNVVASEAPSGSKTELGNRSGEEYLQLLWWRDRSGSGGHGQRIGRLSPWGHRWAFGHRLMSAGSVSILCDGLPPATWP